ncbi:MAG: WG repeat-containing protein [Flavobacteriales bacterium]|nr:WG repeat-containing protein [Flavobacteriales bacterium]
MSRTWRGGTVALLLVLMATTTYAGKLEKAFAALEVHDYFKAKDLFEKEVRKQPAAAWYGLSVITGRADNPFYRLDSSHAAILRSAAAYRLLDGRGRDKIGKLGVDSAAIQARMDHVASIAWKQVSDVDRLETYEHFIDTYTGSDRIPLAIDRRNELAFMDTRKANTSTAYKQFLDRYPEAKEAYGARSRLQEAIYREATPNGTIAQYEAFIKDHPENTYLRDAQDRLLELNTPGHSSGEFAAFIHRYPENPNVPEAWRSIYDLYTKELSVNNITRFLTDYPDYPFINELMNDYKVASLVLYPFRQGGKWGFIDDTGVERIKAEFDFAEPFIHGQAQVGRDGQIGAINKLGKPVVPIIYDDVMDYKEGLATVELNGKQGAVDRNGKLVVPLEYDEVGEYDHGLAAASKGGLYGYIDEAGKEIIPFIYDRAMHFINGMAVVSKDDQSGIIDANGELVVPFQYDWVEGFVKLPLSRVRKGGNMGFINRFGDVLLAVEHDHVGTLNDSLVLVIDKGKCGYVNANGAWVIPQRFDANALTINLGDLHNGVARVLSGGKLGLVDVKGNRILIPQYSDIGLFESGLVPVKKKKWGYATHTSAMATEFKYDQAWELHGGYGRVELGGLFGLVDSTGAELIAPHYTGLSDLDKGILIATGDHGSGVVNATGKVLVALEYDTVGWVGTGLIKVTREDRFAYVKLSDGQILWKEDGFDGSSAD